MHLSIPHSPKSWFGQRCKLVQKRERIFECRRLGFTRVSLNRRSQFIYLLVSWEISRGWRWKVLMTTSLNQRGVSITFHDLFYQFIWLPKSKRYCRVLLMHGAESGGITRSNLTCSVAVFTRPWRRIWILTSQLCPKPIKASLVAVFHTPHYC